MRHTEIVRQWTLLRTLEASRLGVTVNQLARELRVSTRTIWRDMEALQTAGFPLYSDKRGRETSWKLNAAPFKALADLGISLLELCSLYMGRAMVAGLAGAPFAGALAAMCQKVERTLPPKMREFLDRLPSIIESKAGSVKKAAAAAHNDDIGKLLEATLHQRVCRMRYFSVSSNRAKEYLVHPYRLVHAEGGMYLLAWVPEYQEVRTFAIERIRKLSLTEECFAIASALSTEAFGHSLGVHRGKPERIVVTFDARLAPHVRERVWHKSQRIEELANGRVRMTLHVCSDWALRSWILGFGPFVKVESPGRLAEEILAQIDAARDAYAPRFDFALPSCAFAIDHPRLPGLGPPRPS